MTVFQAFIFTLRTILTTRPIVSTLIMAVVIYGFFYPAAYQSQVASQLPIAIVDQDQSQLSRQIIHNLSINPSLSVKTISSSQDEVERMINSIGLTHCYL